MSKRYEFDRNYANYPLSSDERLMIVGVNAEGDDIETLLDSAQVYLETWHGDEYGVWSLGDLPGRQYDQVVDDITSWLLEQEKTNG